MSSTPKRNISEVAGGESPKKPRPPPHFPTTPRRNRIITREGSDSPDSETGNSDSMDSNDEDPYREGGVAPHLSTQPTPLTGPTSNSILTGAVPSLLIPKPPGDFPPIRLITDILTDTWTEAQKKSIKCTPGERKALGYVSEDNPGNDSGMRRELFVGMLHAYGFQGISPPKQVGLEVEGNIVRRGNLDRRQGAFFVLENLSAEHAARFADRSCWSSTQGTIFVLLLPLPANNLVGTLQGPTFRAELCDATRESITNSISEALVASPIIHAQVYDYHDVFPNLKSVDEVLAEIKNTVRVEAIPPKTGIIAQWSLYVASPTAHPRGYAQWLMAIRGLTFETDYGSANVRELTHCTICYGMDHTSSFCPYPSLPGWNKQVALRTPTAGGRGRPRGGAGKRSGGPQGGRDTRPYNGRRGRGN